MHSSFCFVLPSARYSAILLPSIIRVQDKSLVFTLKFTGLVPVAWPSCKHMLVSPIAFGAMQSYTSAGLATLQSEHRSHPSYLWTGDDFGLKSWQAVTSWKIHLFVFCNYIPSWSHSDPVVFRGRVTCLCLYIQRFRTRKNRKPSGGGKKFSFLLFFHFIATGKVVPLQSPLKAVCYHLGIIFKILFLKINQFQDIICPVNG